MSEADSSTMPQAIKALLGELPALFSDRVKLLALEMNRAGRALAQIVALLAVAAIFAATAWLAFWAGVVLLLHRSGVPMGGVVLIVLAINLLAALLAIWRIRGLARWLTLPATMRRLTVTTVAPINPEKPSEQPHAG